jgi:hypothetical protein
LRSGCVAPSAALRGEDRNHIALSKRNLRDTLLAIHIDVNQYVVRGVPPKTREPVLPFVCVTCRNLEPGSLNGVVAANS